MTVLEGVVQALRAAAAFNQHEVAAPRLVIWPDLERQWEECIDVLRSVYPALWSLGEYDPGQASGPAPWLRHQLAAYGGPDLPVLYLPGVPRSAFRSADQCPEEARHLYALQFQGQFFTQKNGKDWTPFAFLASADGGLGLDVAGDQETRKAIQECLLPLLEVEVKALQTGKLEAADFRAIVTKDPARTLLRWMGDPDGIRVDLLGSGSKWASFCAVCRDRYGFDPEKDGPLTAAESLRRGQKDWPLVWERYKEAPRAFPGIRELLERLPAGGLFDEPSEYEPRRNRDEEQRLEAELLALGLLSTKDATTRIKELAAEHGARASWVWAAFGEAPLAEATCHLLALAKAVETCPTPTSWGALTNYYANSGWKVDADALRALGAARSASSLKAVAASLRAIYQPWLEKLSVLAQDQAASYPTTNPAGCRTLAVENGTIYLFADGFRLDLARLLEEKLRGSGLGAEVEFRCDWTSVPTVTATAKPAWQPMASKLCGPLAGTGFQANEKDTGKAMVQARFEQLLPTLGIAFVEPNNLGDPGSCAWTEFGSVDKYGHDQGAKLAWRVDEELSALRQRISDLLHAGWAKVVLVTDHGWLLLPGGLPKVDLPSHLTKSRWGRCAVPAPGAKHGFPRSSWFWDTAEEVVLAPGIGCFVAGKEYAHGGLTPQEALIPTLVVRTTGEVPAAITLNELKWIGMRLNVRFEGAEGLTLDVRTHIEDPSSSLATPAVIAADGERTSILIPDDDAVDTSAHLVVLSQAGKVVFQKPVVIAQG